jgi:hypothetical protein
MSEPTLCPRCNGALRIEDHSPEQVLCDCIITGRESFRSRAEDLITMERRGRIAGLREAAEIAIDTSHLIEVATSLIHKLSSGELAEVMRFAQEIAQAAMDAHSDAINDRSCELEKDS